MNYAFERVRERLSEITEGNNVTSDDYDAILCKNYIYHVPSRT